VDGEAVSVTASPLQTVPSLLAVPDVSVKEIVGETEFTVTDVEAEAEQAVAVSVTVTE
jgi:hypothetical protein